MFHHELKWVCFGTINGLGVISFAEEVRMPTGSGKIMRFAAVLSLVFCPTAAFAQIDLFGNIANTIGNNLRRGTVPFTNINVEIGWNVTAAEVSFQYSPVGNPADQLIPVPNTSQSFTNGGANQAQFPYQSLCIGTVKHTWVITDGLVAAPSPLCAQCGTLLADFNSLSGIDSASPDSGTTHLQQGETISRSVTSSQHVQASVPVPPMTTATFQTYFDVRPIDKLPFEVKVKIGGSYSFSATTECSLRGAIPERCTTANTTSVQGLGTFYKQNPDPHVQPIDDKFVIVTLHGQYTGAIGKTPGNFTCNVMTAN